MLKWIRRIRKKVPNNTYIELIGGDYDGMVALKDVVIMESFRIPICHPIKINNKLIKGPVAGYAIYSFREINFDKEKPRAIYKYLGKVGINA